MSTRGSLRFETEDATGQQVHLYREVFDHDNVYLELTGFPFEAASSAELSGQGPGRVTIRLPHKWAKELGLLEA